MNNTSTNSSISRSVSLALVPTLPLHQQERYFCDCYFWFGGNAQHVSIQINQFTTAVRWARFTTHLLLCQLLFVCVCVVLQLFSIFHIAHPVCVCVFFSLHFIFLILEMFAIQFSLLLLVLYLCLCLPCISWMSLLLLLGSECNKTKWKCSKLCVLCRLNR